MFWNILGIIYVIVMMWCVWEAWNAPLMPDDYGSEYKDKQTIKRKNNDKNR